MTQDPVAPPPLSHPFLELERRYARLEAVYGLTRRIAGAATVDEVCQAAVDTLLEAVPGRRCSILLFDRERVMRFRAWRGLSERYRRAVDGHSPWVEGQRDAAAFVVDDIELDSSMASLVPVFREEGIRALAFVPLNARGAVIGKFMIYGADPGSCLSDDVRLAQLIADHAALALERQRAEAELSRERALFNTGPVVVFRWRNEAGWPVEYVSANVAQFGWDPADLLTGRVPYASIVHPDDLARVAAEVAEHSARGTVRFEQDYRIRTREGSYRSLHDFTVVVRDVEGRATHFDGYVFDVTERKLLEEQLLHAQKMESIGRLAGGVAHDFNNLLTAINGYADLAAQQCPTGEVASFIENIRLAGQRAASLTAQLLTFARKQVVAPRVLDLPQVLREALSLLQRLIGEDIQISLKDEGAWPVRADAGQLQQVVINLVVNARDAMPDGGRLELSTRPVSLGADDARRLQLAAAGDHTCLEVQDTGSGMSEEVKRHLFEPFFTTKEVGRGTGLGLATCYGIVRQSGGAIEVWSALGEGSRFRIYLPRAAQMVREEVHPTPPPRPARRATVLLVEDEPMVRSLTAQILEREGLEVLQAPSAEEALRIWEANQARIALLLTDVVMPGMSGRELATALRAGEQRLRVLFVTGYSEALVTDRQALAEGEALMSKPYTPAMLVERVRELLD